MKLKRKQSPVAISETLHAAESKSIVEALETVVILEAEDNRQTPTTFDRLTWSKHAGFVAEHTGSEPRSLDAIAAATEFMRIYHWGSWIGTGGDSAQPLLDALKALPR